MSSRDDDDAPRLLADVLEHSEDLTDDELDRAIGEAISTNGWAQYHDAARRDALPDRSDGPELPEGEALVFEWKSGRSKAATGAGGRSWHDNSSKVVNAEFGSLTENDREHIRKTMATVRTLYGRKADLPLTIRDGVKIRSDFSHVVWEPWTATDDVEAYRDDPEGDELGDWMDVGGTTYVGGDSWGGLTGYRRHPAEDREPPEPDYKTVAKGERKAAVAPFTWVDAVGQLLTKYMTAEATTVWLKKVDGEGEHLHGVPALMRWMPEQQRQYAAQLDAWVRELCGGTRPSGGESQPEYDDPHIALITLTASARPDGEAFVGPVDHMRSMQESWPRTRDALRNAMVRAGFDTDAWQYDRRAEPHTARRGGGTNTAYTHEHIVLITDGKVTREDLQPVLDTHVKYNRYAAEWAHGSDSVQVKRHDELTNAADYVADYASIEATDIRERGVPYVMWAAAATACGYRTVSRSEATTAAVRADRCKQRYESDESLQRWEHGERLTWDGRGRRCCRECGSFHGVAQDGSVAAQRLPDTPDAVADGGVDITTADDVVARERRIWRDADAGARVGMAPDRARFRRVVLEWLDTLDGPPPQQPWEVVEAMREARPRIVPPYWIPEGWMLEVIKGVTIPQAYDGEAVGWGRRESGSGWRISHVTVFNEDRPASPGGGVDMVTTVNYPDRFRGLWAEGELCTCAKCGMSGRGEWIVNHLTAGREGHDDDGRHRVRHAEPLLWLIQPDALPVSRREWAACVDNYAHTGVCTCGGHTAVAALWHLHAALSMYREPHLWEG